MTMIRLLPVLISVAIADAHAATARRCSRVPIAASRAPEHTYFVGRARPDTVLAGPGEVRHTRGPGHWGSRRVGAIHGQVVDIDSLAGHGADAPSAWFARTGVRQAIVVPWDYDSGCEPVAWGQSARWTTTAEPGFYKVRLRPEALWIGGRPVLDAFTADLDPYPHAMYYARGYRGTDAIRTGPALTAEEFFTFYRALPEHPTQSSIASTNAAIEAWTRAHPEAALKYPARELLRRLGVQPR
jgi:hypothetical protein